ncbi:MAG: hypothetical protein QOI10_1641 [Solirubrobacterales bacterium]|nr:hypothetical protein [Solirubrobacterales bacterium]
MTASDMTGERMAAAALMALMAVGSLAVWTVIPIAGLWLASQLSNSPAEMGFVPLLALAAGIPTAMAFVGLLLARAERVHMRLTGTAPRARVEPAWRRSLSDSGSLRLTVLDKLMVASVLVAALAMVVWFFALAGSSLPSSL